MLRHNKKRNTAFLYEALVREVVKHALNKDVEERDRVIATLKEHFSPVTEIGKELRLFKTLLETKNVSSRMAEKLIQETKLAYKNLDKERIFEEQSALIKKINKELSKNIFSNFVPSYRDLATLSQIFGEDLSVKRKVILEESILRSLTSRGIQTKNKDKINNLIVNKFVERFNNQYGQKLFENQKELLNKFILSFIDNGVDFKLFLNEEIENLKKVINKSFTMKDVKDDEKMVSKMKEVKKLLENYSKEPINKESLQQFLKIQALAAEIES
tara:strand:+ start:2347 stop:3162 length:816 start_codon:yes stop_codon:yes gene_type:complete